MRIITALLLLTACLGSTSAAPAPEKIRTVNDIPGLPVKVLQRTISSTIYKHLLVSPIEGWIAVRGRLSNTHIYGAKVIHSELGGIYDEYALRLARETQIAGYFTTGSNDSTASIVVNVLIYQIRGDTMALSYPFFEEPGGEQLEYYGATTLATLQNNGRWTNLKLPQGPLGKVWTVRAGVANRYDLAMKLNQIVSGR